MGEQIRKAGWDAFQKLEKKSIVTSPYDLTYTYYLSPSFHEKAKSKAPTLLLLHGFPDDAYMWAATVPTLLKLPNAFVIPDLLGFAGSFKPTDPERYRWRQQADSLAQILELEGLKDNVIPVGHDWGSGIASRFYLYYVDRCVGVAPLSLPYWVPTGEVFNHTEANKQGKEKFGYWQWEYWNFFMADDGAKLMEDNLERFYEALHGNYPPPVPEEKGRDIWMRELFCVPNAMREYVTGTGKYEGYRVPLKPYAEDPELKKYFIERLGHDGLSGPVCYYKALAQNKMLEDERDLVKKPETRVISKPYLYIGFTGDWVPRTDLNQPSVESGLIKDYEEHIVEAGHWSLYEKPVEIVGILADWLKRRFPGEKA